MNFARLKTKVSKVKVTLSKSPSEAEMEPKFIVSSASQSKLGEGGKEANPGMKEEPQEASAFKQKRHSQPPKRVLPPLNSPKAAHFLLTGS